MACRKFNALKSLVPQLRRFSVGGSRTSVKRRIVLRLLASASVTYKKFAVSVHA
jgi:hypothetical protein